MFGGGYTVSSRSNKELRSRRSNLSLFNTKNQPKDSTPLIQKEVKSTINPITYPNKKKELIKYCFLIIVMICAGLLFYFWLNNISFRYYG